MEVPPTSTYGMQPTYQGIIPSTLDALILVEACLRGILNHVSRRPHEVEREQVIRSGNIFIYEENASSIKRWTDGISWSPSRILCNFLIYRQLENAPKASGNRRTKKQRTTIKSELSVASSEGVRTTKELIKEHVHADDVLQLFPRDPQILRTKKLTKFEVDIEKCVIGSLTDSSNFTENGLVKKTISVTIGCTTHHLVSYYSVADALKRGKLQIPSKDPKFTGLRIRHELIDGQGYRLPPGEMDPLGRTMNVYRGEIDLPVIPCTFMGVSGHLVPHYPMVGGNEQQPHPSPPQLPQSFVRGQHSHVPYMQALYEQGPHSNQPYPHGQHTQQQYYQQSFQQQPFQQELYSQMYPREQRPQGSNSQEWRPQAQYPMDPNMQQWHPAEQHEQIQYHPNQYQLAHNLDSFKEHGFIQQGLNHQVQYQQEQIYQFPYQHEQSIQLNIQSQNTPMYPSQPLIEPFSLSNPNVQLIEPFPVLNSDIHQISDHPNTSANIDQVIEPVVMANNVPVSADLGLDVDLALETSSHIPNQGEGLSIDIPMPEGTLYTLQNISDERGNHTLPMRVFPTPSEEFEHSSNRANDNSN